MTINVIVSPEVHQSDDAKILRDIWYALVIAEMGELNPAHRKHQMPPILVGWDCSAGGESGV
jgi:hypothetical protein